MRILFVTHQYPPRFQTGTELYADRLARKLMDPLGHEVRVFTFEPGAGCPRAAFSEQETEHEGLRVRRVFLEREAAANPVLASYYYVLLGKSFGRLLDEFRPHVAHVFHAAFLGASLIEEARLRRVPAVVSLMDDWFLCPTAQLLRARAGGVCPGPDLAACLDCLAAQDAGLEPLRRVTAREGFVAPPHAALRALEARPRFLRQILESANRIVAPSQTLRALFARFGYDPRSIHLVRYGVEPPPRSTRLRPAGGTLRVGYIGSINRPKGACLLAEAAAGLAGDLSVDIFGDDTLFPDYADEVRAAAQGDPRVRLRGALQPERVYETLAGLDLLVVPSLWHENTPFVVLEAQAAGVPVLGADVPGIAEIVADRVNGRLFRAGDAAHLRALLSELLRDRAEVRSMAARSGDVRTLLENARDFEEMYAELKGAAPAGAPQEERAQILERHADHLLGQLYHQLERIQELRSAGEALGAEVRRLEGYPAALDSAQRTVNELGTALFGQKEVELDLRRRMAELEAEERVKAAHIERLTRDLERIWRSPPRRALRFLRRLLGGGVAAGGGSG
ncbi:MAG: glycosyltransferase [Planctomycetes bacterium]|nr:glycosyltransferase [Planctomycetota bacterium]